MADTTRRLPIFFVLDVSGSMGGDPIEGVKVGLQMFHAGIKDDPSAIEVAHESIITFNSSARQVVPLTEVQSVQLPSLVAGGETALGDALRVLDDAMAREVRHPGPEVKGDYKPLVFLMTDGQPTDSWAGAADQLRKHHSFLMKACAAGANANRAVLEQIAGAENVVVLSSLQPDEIKRFFVLATQTARQSARSPANQAPAPAPAPGSAPRACQNSDGQLAVAP
jgi:uncharacterized protein YegL